jgi:hypothetical protein
MIENVSIITFKMLLKFAESMITIHIFYVKYYEIKTMLFANNPELTISGTNSKTLLDSLDDTPYKDDLMDIVCPSRSQSGIQQETRVFRNIFCNIIVIHITVCNCHRCGDKVYIYSFNNLFAGKTSWSSVP